MGMKQIKKHLKQPIIFPIKEQIEMTPYPVVISNKNGKFFCLQFKIGRKLRYVNAIDFIKILKKKKEIH